MFKAIQILVAHVERCRAFTSTAQATLQHAPLHHHAGAGHI